MNVKLGRPDAMTGKMVAGVLANLELGVKPVTRYYLERVAAKGYVAKKNVANGKRGRPTVEYVVTGKGRGLLAMAKNWQ